MIIFSHKHKYVFVELPQTASSAIARELVANYDEKRSFSSTHSTAQIF